MISQKIDALYPSLFVYYIKEHKDNCDSSVSFISGLKTTQGGTALKPTNSE